MTLVAQAAKTLSGDLASEADVAKAVDLDRELLTAVAEYAALDDEFYAVA